MYSLAFISMINAIVGILTCIGMINATSERLIARKNLLFSFYEQLKFYAHLS